MLGSNLSNERLPLSKEPGSKLLARKASLCGKNYEVRQWDLSEILSYFTAGSVKPSSDERSVTHCQIVFPLHDEIRDDSLFLGA